MFTYFIYFSFFVSKDFVYSASQFSVTYFFLQITFCICCRKIFMPLCPSHLSLGPLMRMFNTRLIPIPLVLLFVIPCIIKLFYEIFF
jgi:hypothetical protein